jgi:hypothetical protein
MNRRSLFWGTLFILVGGLFLLANLGIIAVSAWALILPVGIIALGLWLLFGLGGGGSPPEHASIPLNGANAAQVRINHGAGKLVVQAGAEPGELLSAACGGGLHQRTSRAGSRLDLVLSVPEGAFPFFGWSGRTLDWDLRFNPDVPLSLDVRYGASETVLDLEDLRVIDLKLSTGASSTRLTLPAAAGFTLARVEAGAASVDIRIPSGVGARVRSEAGLADIHLDQARFERHGDRYVTSDFEYADNKVDLEIQAGVGSVRVH